MTGSPYNAVSRHWPPAWATQSAEADLALLRREGFFSWGQDAWCHDLGDGVMHTEEAVEWARQMARERADAAR